MDVIARLKYLKDSMAEKEDRQCLDEAIMALVSLKTNNKLLTARKKLDIAHTPEEIEEACKELQYPEHEWVPHNFRKILSALSTTDEDSTQFNIPNSILNQPLHILEDDGSGYGAFNSYAFCGCIVNKEENQQEAQIWI